MCFSTACVFGSQYEKCRTVWPRQFFFFFPGHLSFIPGPPEILYLTDTNHLVI